MNNNIRNSKHWITGNRNYEPIWYEADHPTMKPVSAHMDIQRRIIEKFAWMPRTMDSGENVWFKRYVVIEKFMNQGPTHQVLYSNCYTQEHFVEMKLKGIIE